MTDFPGFVDPQRRILGVTVNNIRILNLYVPNGESVSSVKYEYKLNWLQNLNFYLKDQLAKYQNVVILGDFNIAPADIDVHDPILWNGRVLCSHPERKAFFELIELGFTDCYRHINPQEKSFSWWDYRMNAFKRQLGMRIDHILATSSLVATLQKCYIDTTPRGWERPSDHAPVIAEFHL